MHNINPYDEQKCRAYCQQLEFFNQIQTDFDRLSWTKNYCSPRCTPREYLGVSTFSMVPFYYLEKLLEKDPVNIYDLGCGWNIFKRYIPTIIGVSPTQDNYADIHDLVDDKYIKGHTNFFDSVFSINVLHFKSLEKLEKIVTEFVSMIKPGGRGFLSLNLMRMVERSSFEFLEKSIGTNRTSIDYEQYVRSVLEKINIGYLIVDIDFSRTLDDYIDGNIRLVIDKE